MPPNLFLLQLTPKAFNNMQFKRSTRQKLQQLVVSKFDSLDRIEHTTGLVYKIKFHYFNGKMFFLIESFLNSGKQ